MTGDAILSYFPPPSVKDIKGQFFYRTHANYYWNQWLEKQVGITFTEAEFASEKEKRNAKMALERFEHFSDEGGKKYSRTNATDLLDLSRDFRERKTYQAQGYIRVCFDFITSTVITPLEPKIEKRLE